MYGKNSVLERLKTKPESIKKVFLQDNFNEPHIEKLIIANNISLERLSSDELIKIKPQTNTQGIIARVDKYAYTSFEDLLSYSTANQLTLIFLDRIYDPQNLGAIIRTAACFGRFAIIIPQFEACEVNETVLHVASGGENYILISLVSNLPKAIVLAKECGYWIIGAQVSDDACDITKIPLLFPLGFVLGSEGKGIRPGIQKHLDIKVRIPMEGAKLSFNVSLSCAIFCYEIVKQRKLK
ncbi:MAG: 23S rRNA (guanosine(2251)-2'-O)-methyltransferase RlmB [bacterium]